MSSGLYGRILNISRCRCSTQGLRHLFAALPAALGVIFMLESRLIAQEQKASVKIGVIVPLTGDMALHGVEVQQSMNLALAQDSKSARHYDYKLIFEDNQLDGAKSVAAAHRLIDVERVDSIVTLWPPTASVVIPISEKAQVLHYTISWDPELAKAHKYVLSHQAMVDQIVRSTLGLMKSEKKKKIAFLHLEEAGFNLGAKYLRDSAKTEGITLVSDDSFGPQERDFRALIERIERQRPEGYLIWSVMPSIDLLIRQILSRNPKAYISGYLDYAEDLSGIQHAKYISEMFSSDDFVKAYKERFSVLPVSKGPNAFDIMKLLVLAFEHSPEKKPTASELKTFLTGIRNFDGAVGRFSIDSYGNSDYPPVIREIEGSGRLHATSEGFR